MKFQIENQETTPIRIVDTHVESQTRFDPLLESQPVVLFPGQSLNTILSSAENKHGFFLNVDDRGHRLHIKYRLVDAEVQYYFLKKVKGLLDENGLLKEL